MLSVTHVLSYLIVQTSNERVIIMNHEQLSKLNKIVDFKIEVPLSHHLVQSFLYMHIIFVCVCRRKH